MISSEHRYDSMPVAYRETLRHIHDYGHYVSPRGMRTKELIGHSFTLTDPIYNIVTQATRKINHSFMAAEFLWMITGSNDARLLVPYNKQMAQYAFQAPDLSGPLYLQGAYGPKLIDQLPYILETLGTDRDSRQALLTIWRERPGPSKDIPCTCLMQFFIRNGLLDMIVYMRSNDAWLGLPYDVFNFTMIQHYVASLLEVDLGWYHHHTGSLHLYEQHWEKSRLLLDEDLIFNPVMQTDRLTAPIPPETWTVFNGMSLMGSHREMPPEAVSQWIDLSGANKYPEWIDLLRLCAYRFNQKVEVLPHQWRTLVRYWDQHDSEQAAEQGG